MSVCQANAEGKKTFLILSLFQNCVCAKINSVYYCENVLEQSLLPTIRRISNNDFVFKQDGAPCIRHSPHCRLAAFQCAWVHWTRKLAADQARFKSRGLLSVYSVVADSVTSQNVRHYSAEASSDRLLGSAKPGLIEPTSCQKGLIVIKAKGVVMLNFVKKTDFFEIR